MKLIFTFLVFALASVLSLNFAYSAQEWGVDRPGGDYRNFNLSTDSPAACENQCGVK